MRKFKTSEKVASVALVAIFLLLLAGLGWILLGRGEPIGADLRVLAAGNDATLPLTAQEELGIELQKLEEQLAAATSRLADATEENQLLIDEQLANPLPPEGLLNEYVGEFHATAYCCEVYPHVCGGNGITASGTKPQPGVTCATDWDVLPPGTYIYIEDVGVRRVEDSGSAIKGQRLDIAIDTHDNALKWSGFGTHRVWVLIWGDGRNNAV